MNRINDTGAINVRDDSPERQACLKDVTRSIVRANVWTLPEALPKVIFCILGVFFLFSGSAWGQIGAIEGRAIDAESGEPLPGVNVVVEGTQRGAATNSEGRYQIASVEVGSYDLRASFVGYQDQLIEGVEVVANQTREVNFELQVAEAGLDEVVVVGYGTQRRRDLTGSVASVSAEDLEEIAVESMDQALQGLTAGALVKNTSGAPGGGISVRIRGMGSVTSGNEPLFVIDGVPVVNDLGGVPGTANPLATLSPSNIQSIQVLKDASATAIYGSRGSNGVVLIETKQGNTGRAQVTFSSSVGITETARRYNLISGPEYVRFADEAAANRGIEDRWPDAPDSYPSFDWQDAIYQNGLNQNYSLAISGGDDDTRYNVSGNFADEQGVIDNSSFRRYSFRVNLDQEVSDDFRVQTNISASRGEYGTIDTGGSGVTRLAIQMPPNLLAFQEEGDRYTSFSRDTPFPAEPIENPLALIEAEFDDSRINRLLGSSQLAYNLLDNLELRVRVGTDLEEFRRDLFQSRRLVELNQDGNAQIWNRRRVNVLNDNVAEYNQSFGEEHSLNVLGGFTWQKEFTRDNFLQNANFVTEGTGTDAIEAGSQEGGPSINSGRSEWTLLSSLTRINYTFRDRYLFTFTARADGSSKFGVGNKWGFFPSGAVAWQVSEEPWMRATFSSVSDLKLRLSFGRSGNQEIGTYASLAQLGTVNYLFGGPSAQEIVGFIPSQVTNPDLRWETSEQWDLGLDVGLWNGRLRASVDLYEKETTGLILPVTLPVNSGFDAAVKNTGTVENRGIEVSVDGSVIAGDFSWRTGLNWSANRNEVVDLGESDQFWGPSVVPGDAEGSLVREGEPIGMFWGMETDGIINSQAEAGELGYGEPGDFHFVDQDGDGQITEGDRTIIGNPHPDFVYGWTNTFSLKNWSLNAFVQGTFGNDIWNENNQLMYFNGTLNVTRERFDNRWTPENVERATEPKAGVITQGPANGRMGDFIVEDGSYLRLRTLTLSYNIPVGKLGWLAALGQARIYVQGRNLFTITNYTGLNPDVDTRGNGTNQQNTVNVGFDSAAYPTVREYVAGINLTF